MAAFEFSNKKSGGHKNLQNRSELKSQLNFVRTNDKVVVTSLDHLG